MWSPCNTCKQVTERLGVSGFSVSVLKKSSPEFIPERFCCEFLSSTPSRASFTCQLPCSIVCGTVSLIRRGGGGCAGSIPLCEARSDRIPDAFRFSTSSALLPLLHCTSPISSVLRLLLCTSPCPVYIGRFHCTSLFPLYLCFPGG